MSANVEHVEQLVGEGLLTDHPANAVGQYALGGHQALLSVKPHHLQRLFTDALEAEHGSVYTAGHQHGCHIRLTGLGWSGHGAEVASRTAGHTLQFEQEVLFGDVTFACHAFLVELYQLRGYNCRLSSMLKSLINGVLFYFFLHIFNHKKYNRWQSYEKEKTTTPHI